MYSMNQTTPSSRPFGRLLGLVETAPTSDRLVLRVLFFAVVFSFVFLLYAISTHFSAVTPIAGGTFKEGMVGTPRFVNPTLAITRADQDMTALVYSSLMKINTEGSLVPDAAESVTVSEDGLTYNIVVRKDIRFHDGKPLTARDVVYTIELIQNADLKSPLRGNWNGVTVEQLGEYELNIVLEEPYAPFVENFQFGIMPDHLWSTLPIEQIPFSQLNTEPVGSGPFKVERVVRDTSGLITKYLLAAHLDNPTKPNIDTFEAIFYTEESQLLEAFQSHEIDASAYVSNENIATLQANGTYQIISEPLPRIFGVFLNQNKSSALRDPAVREALSIAIDRNKIIQTALHGYGVPMTSPVTTSENALQSQEGSPVTDHAASIERAKQILNDAGWRTNNLGLLEKQVDGNAEMLTLTLRTSNVPLFTTITDTVVDDWKAIGVEVATEQYEQTGLVQSVIRPRDFQALLFGLDMSRGGDLYPFWHSSQKDDPGLNIAQYTNLSVDAILESSRTEQSPEAQKAKRAEASKIISEERPAIFLFQPMMVYVVKSDVIVSDIAEISRPSDRFSNSTQWYTDSDTLWPLFRNNN
jgi:peptide/nickel transport system substrate-binding protein